MREITDADVTQVLEVLEVEDVLEELQDEREAEDEVSMSADFVSSDTMVLCAVDIRKAKKTGVPSPINATLSTRSLLTWGEAMRGMGLRPLKAANLAFLNRATDSDREVMSKFVTNRMGS